MLKMFKNLTKKELILIITSIVLIIVQVFFELKLPDYMSKITKLMGTNDLNEVIKYGIYMLLFSIISLIISFIIGYLASFVGTSFEKHLRRKVFMKVQSYSMEEVKKFSTSSLITRNTNDITQVKMFVILGIQMLARAPIMAVMAIIKILGKEWQFSLVTLVGVLLLVVLNTFIILVAIPKFKKIQKMTDNLNSITRENLTGIRVVRAFNAEEYQNKKFEKANNELTNTHLFTQKIMALIGPTMSIIMAVTPLAIYYIGSILINNASILNRIDIFSDMVVFSSYSIQVILSFMMISLLFVIYPRASVCANRINEVFDTNSKIEYGSIKKDNELKGVVEFKNVSFKYPDAEECILKDINFKVNKGETIALIGSTGCGKSTVVNLIPRFYDVTSGEILIDGINIKEYDKEYLHSKIGYVSQSAFIFKDSVKNNVSFGKVNKHKVKEQDIDNALDISSSSEFVKKMDKGINSLISQGGHNLSGGQKQRISIARAIARNPEIYIFDDSFSALDFKTDYELRKKINKYAKDATKFIVAQRIGTIKNADKIVVLDEGKIVGIGTHKELLKTCKIYQEIAESQLSKEEIENA